MFKLSFAASLIAGVFSVSALAADGVETQQQEQVREQGAARPQLQQREQFSERIYGSQLMTPAERLDYRNKMRNMKTQAERDQFRLEHHKQMQERARERGVTLPDEPPVRGGGMGPGGGVGPGGGMGPGGMGPGMGPGGGRTR